MEVIGTRQGLLAEPGRVAAPVYFLRARKECDPYVSPLECGPVSSGVERWWIQRKKNLAEQRDAHLREGDEAAAKKLEYDLDLTLKHIHKWSALADQLWTTACDSLAAGLPQDIAAYVVAPSGRAARREPLVAAMRKYFGAAAELVYEEIGEIDAGTASEADIDASLRRVDNVQLGAAAVVAVVDDWLGEGKTFRTLAARVRRDHHKTEITIIGAFPGVGSLASVGLGSAAGTSDDA